MSKQARRNAKSESTLKVFPQATSQDEEKMPDTMEFAPIDPLDVDPKNDSGDWRLDITRMLQETALAVKDMKDMTGLMKDGFNQLQDHGRRITDHDYRIEDLEKRMGLIGWVDGKAKAKGVADAPKAEPQPQPQPKPQSDSKSAGA